MKQKLLFRVHAVERMFERGITAKSVRNSLEHSEAIEDYSSDMNQPSHLILGFQGKRPVHLVTSENPQVNEIIVITVYIPDPQKWKKDFRRRK
jgi:hypothetical protein